MPISADPMGSLELLARTLFHPAYSWIRDTFSYVVHIVVVVVVVVVDYVLIRWGCPKSFTFVSFFFFFWFEIFFL